MKKVLSALALWFAAATSVALAQAGPTPVPSSVPYVGTINASQVVPSSSGANATFGGTYPYIFPTAVSVSSLSSTGNIQTSNGVLTTNSTTTLQLCTSSCFDTIDGTTGAFFAPSASFTNALPITSGGTGSTTKNFVDLSTTQTAAGVKTFSSGISTAGITSTVAGNFMGPAASSLNQFEMGASGCAANYSDWETNPSITVATVAASAFGINCSINALAVDASGDLGIAGNFQSVGSVTAGTFGVIGPASPSATTNYLTYGTVGTYPYVAGVYDGHEHIEKGATPAVTTAGVTVNFNTAYASTPVCTVSWNSSSPPTYQLGVATTTAHITVYSTTSSSYGATFICVQ